MPLSARQKQIQQAEQDAAFMDTFMDMLARGLWMPWGTLDADGEIVLFATEEGAKAYVEEIHGPHPNIPHPAQLPIRFAIRFDPDDE